MKKRHKSLPEKHKQEPKMGETVIILKSEYEELVDKAWKYDQLCK